MSKTCLVATKFESFVEGLPPTYGVRMYDGYQKTYDNTGTEKSVDWTDNLALLEWVIEMHRPRPSNEDIICDMLQSLADTNTGIEINGHWYDWEEIMGHFPQD